MRNSVGRELIDDGEPALGAKVAFLAAPGTYPGAPAVETRETHMAWVFLAGDRAFKLKKPVRYPFLDYGTVEARRHVCEEEVRLNRRLAPDVYLGVSRLTEAADGSLAIEGPGRTVDWLVVMRRLDETMMLDRAILAGTVGARDIEAVGDRLAAFYQSLPAEKVPPGARLARYLSELALSRDVLGTRRFDSVSDRGLGVVGQLAEWLDRRPQSLAATGPVVEGHGDLRPEHVCLTDPPVIIDCLEFSRELRIVDPFEEICNLGMECSVLGARWIGPLIVARVVAVLGGPPADEVLAFHTAFRASLRSRQALAHLLDPDPREPEKWMPLAARYLDEAEAACASLRSRAARPASHPRGDAGSPPRRVAPR